MAVTKAVLLAAGRGTRLGALTDQMPKPLLDVAGQPIIERILDGLKAAGISEVLIVVGYRGEQIERHLGDGSSVGISVVYARQPSPEGTGRAVSLAKEFVGSERFFVGWGDVLVGASNYARLVNESTQPDAVMAVNKVRDPTNGAAVYVDDHMRVTGIIEKPAPGTSTTPWNNAGLMILPPRIWPLIDELKPSDRREYELPQAVAALVSGGATVRAVPVDGLWFDIGTPESLEEARKAFG
jgi:dTDP-glucose pyrophosphorylase